MRTLIIGSGPNVAAELMTVNRRHFDLTLGINRAAIDHGPVDAHITMHPREYGPRKVAWMVSFHPFAGVNEVFPWRWSPEVKSSGSSGLYAIKYALYRGSQDITLAGVGLDVAPHYYGGPDWQAAMQFRRAWEQVLPEIRGKVYSLGGWTRGLLGPQL
ncbi:hypothetical protein [Panacagrimonas sp.]|uniref:hypothetical protein n=1 Tax=Panacagrimonas sp. TaxID=2480088 RepID=UPI003B530151